MKNLTFIFLISLHISIFTFYLAAQPCLPEGIEFTSQEEIDNFQINYPGCIEIEGDVQITGDNITNLNELIVLTSIGGSLKFGEPQIWWVLGNPALESLAGLNNLTSIGGDLTFLSSEVLIDLIGLENLNSIGGNLQIYGAASLIDLAGLENLTSVGGDLTIGLQWTGGYFDVENASLTSFTGLENLIYVGGDLGIYRNFTLTSLTGLEGLPAIGGSFGMADNNILTSLTGLDNIQAESIINISIHNNSYLSTCEVFSICSYLSSPNGTIDIHDNAPGCNSQEEVEDACGFQCLPDGITFTNQEEIDNFLNNYFYCIEIEGDVEINGDDIDNLNGIKCIDFHWGRSGD